MRKLLLLFLFFGLPLFAQNEMRVVGKGEYLPSELIDKTIVDVNGEVCAGLLIKSDLTGFTYDSNNGVVDMKRRTGEDLLFLSPGERQVKIYCSGFAPLTINLYEYGIKLESGQVWQLKVTGDKQSDQLLITISVTPKDASVTLDGKRADITKPIPASIGKHNVKIAKEGYKTIEKEIEATQQQVVFTFSLQEIDLQSVTVNSTPQGAKIYLDNIDKGVTKKGMFLYPGEYTLKLTLSGYLDKDEKITVEEGKGNKFTYTMQKNVGTLSITVTPADAEVAINKEKYDKLQGIELSPGKYKIEVKKKGYYEDGETIEIALGKGVTRSYTLKAKVGKLQFTVTPPEATVEMSRNGKAVQSWQGLKILKELQVGEYDLTIKSAGYKTKKDKVVIAEDKTTVKEITLEQGRDVAANGNMIYVEGGTFEMGSNNGDSDEKPVHSVTIKSFYIGKYEVTQKEWVEIMGSNSSSFKGDNLPVENVSWNDVQEYIRKLNAKTGGKYRLPTEAEWEYAARGGNQSKGYTYSGSNTIDDVAWYDDNSNSNTHVVGTKQPNELGIYDMSGNVWEWCSDWYGESYYSSSPGTNPQGPTSGTYRVLRGGSWYYNAIYCRSTSRSSNPPDYRDYFNGFRIAQDL